MWHLQDGPNVNESVRRVLLPEEAKQLSLGHFLELSLGMQGCTLHGRALHRDFARYFGIGSSAACSHYDFIAPNSVLMPASQIDYDADTQQQWLVVGLEELIEVICALSHHLPVLSKNPSLQMMLHVIAAHSTCPKKQSWQLYLSGSEVCDKGL